MLGSELKMSIDFESLRENGRINISKGIDNGIIHKSEIELEGARNKFWFNDCKYMFKEIFEGSYEDYAELISSELAKEFGIECATYDLAICDGKLGVITKNFVNEDLGEELISGTVIINEVYQMYILPLQEICAKYFAILDKFNIKDNFSNIYKFELQTKRKILKQILELISLLPVDNYTIIGLDNNSIEYLSSDELDDILFKLNELFVNVNEMYDIDFMSYKNGIVKANNLFDLWSIMDIYCKVNGFNLANADDTIKKLSKLFLFDIITSQGDRHTDNWGIIINGSTVKLSPIYDNSNMCNLNRSKTIKSISSIIDLLKTSKTKDAKSIRTEKRLKDSIYHQKSSLKVAPENVIDRANNLQMINEFMKVSSMEDQNEIFSIVEKLNPTYLENVFLRIEERIKAPIPSQIKDIVAKTIEINVNELLQYIELKEAKSYGK